MKVFTSRPRSTTACSAARLDFLGRNEDEFSEFDRMKYEALALRPVEAAEPRAKRKFSRRIPAAYELIGVFAGKTEPVHAHILAKLTTSTWSA